MDAEYISVVEPEVTAVIVRHYVRLVVDRLHPVVERLGLTRRKVAIRRFDHFF